MTEQGPNVSDPEARACLAAADQAVCASQMILCAVRDGVVPEVEDIIGALADAINIVLAQYPGPEDAVQLHAAVKRFLDLE